MGSSRVSGSLQLISSEEQYHKRGVDDDKFNYYCDGVWELQTAR